MAIMNDGFIYVVSDTGSSRLIRPDGNVVATLVLPTMVFMPTTPVTPPTYDSFLTDNAINTSYNGFNALPDGTIVVKSLYRVAGCTENGPSALLNCPNARNVPRPILIGQPGDRTDHRQHHPAHIRGRPAHHHSVPWR
jgi:hypothetical protein